MIYIKSKREVEKVKKSARLLAETLSKLKDNLHVGVRTKELSEIAEKYIKNHNGIPAFKNYRGFPGNICISLNEVVIHGIPDERKLEKSDLVSIDAGVNLDGYFSDAAFTFCLDGASKEKNKLAKVAERCLYKAIEKFQVGDRVFDISHQIQTFAEDKGYSVVRQFVGHGVGVELHEDPQIPNFGKPGKGEELKPGMIFAIEVMVNEGGWEVEILDDGWTTVTKDRKNSAHFEHTVYLSEKGPEILTKL